ncbi:hypothetical protein HLY00_949 [Mycolicibacterium hippocampi]|uniref:Guanylate cyclase domain-containing protein n=1 Tax=Mycolicibacterium hippocampi TaxID=659824 RepID=A0A850PIB3_9MYCO|nr:hypothetical protein [Mycolicibacterium hippocampi]
MLFVDVVRSMQIAAALDVERFRDVMTSVVEQAAGVVRRYGGSVESTGDGVMALFGAPIALEDHAFRACLAALDIQTGASRLAADVLRRDGLVLQLRVGLNSGRVIAGEFGASSLGYTATGLPVGLAQRMESAAPPGVVMLSHTTAHLVEHTARLGPPEWVHVKGETDPVPGRRLLGLADHQGARPGEASFVGRRAEINDALAGLDAAISGRGTVVSLSGPPGIGKSRITRQVAALAATRNVDVFWAYCRSHTSEVPFDAAAELLRSFFGIVGRSAQNARAATRSALPAADRDDLAILDDMLGVSDREQVTDMDPDARRRRLTALLNSALLARHRPAVYVIEDAHWIDEVSEAILSDLFGAVSTAPALVLITHRPEYTGALALTADATIRLDPLDAAASSELVASLLGTDPSVGELACRIADRAAGNPFFIEEIVRDLAERRILTGNRGAYTCSGGADVAVPATVQATIAARIDRLAPSAKRTLYAAAVIGSPFPQHLLASVLSTPALADLTDAELITQVAAEPAEYAFRHPLTHAVAYETQLRSSRAELHRSIAVAIEQADSAAGTMSAALIATHMEAAGDLRDAFDWHMKAGTLATHRDITAARMSWQRAAEVADRLPADDPERLALRIAPRTLLCATRWRVGGELHEVGFDELRQLTVEAGDKRSLTIAMSGMVQMLNFHGRYTEASLLASEQLTLIDSIGDPELAVALIPMVSSIAKWDAGEMAEALELAQRAIDLSAGDPTMGNLIFGSPLAMALVMRASTRCCLGIPGWREDFDSALAIARAVDKFSYSTVVMFKYIAALNWALQPDDAALHDTAEALEIARQFGDNFLLTNAEFTHGLVLVRRGGADRELGFELLARSREVALDHRYTIIAAWCVDLDFATEAIRTGDFDTAVALSRHVLDEEIRCGEGINRGWSTSVLVEALLARKRVGDLAEAGAAIDRLAAMPTEPMFLYHELPLLRLRAMAARAAGDQDGYVALRDCYRARAEQAGFDGHVALARAMT